MANKHSYRYVKEKIESEKGYKLLSSDYVNSVSKLEIECNEGHIFPMSFKVFNKGHRCSYCAGKRQYDINEVRNIFEKRGYRLISKEYKNNRDKLDVVGPDNKKYKTTLFAFKVQNIIPHLKGKVFKNEEECRSIFEEITGKTFPKARLDCLKNPNTNKNLELDGYSKELNIGFEYDGKQHFENVEFTDEKITSINKRDIIKDDLCKQNNIKLIRIPFYIRDKYSYIKNKIKYNNHLIVGDPHIQISNLKDSFRLLKFIEKQAKENNVSKIVFLGDLFHTHAIVRVEVQYFWINAFKTLQKQYDIIALCGNHDMILGESKYAGLNSLSILDEEYKYNISVIDCPSIVDNIAYIPYMSNKEDFLKASAELYEQGATKLLIAHQTFTGATYENGFYAEDGIEPDLVHQENIISGHIHKQQQLGKCFYPGTPKWDTMSDANEDKGIWIFEHNEDGSVKDKKFISTKNIVTPIYKHVFIEGEEEPVLIDTARNYLELLGKAAWITKMKKKYKGKAQIKARPTDRKSVKIERDGLISVSSYVDKFFEPIDGVSKKEVKSYLESLNE